MGELLDFIRQALEIILSLAVLAVTGWLALAPSPPEVPDWLPILDMVIQ